MMKFDNEWVVHERRRKLLEKYVISVFVLATIIGLTTAVLLLYFLYKLAVMGL